MPIPVLDGGIIFFIFFIFIFAVAVAVVATLSSRSVFFGSFFFLDDGFGKALLDFLLFIASQFSVRTSSTETTNR